VFVVAPNNTQVAALAARLADALPADSVLVLAKKIKPEDVPSAVFSGDRERPRSSQPFTSACARSPGPW
jgi:hypothetical protein